jgi:hypothetical protein
MIVFCRAIVGSVVGCADLPALVCRGELARLARPDFVACAAPL